MIKLPELINFMNINQKNIKKTFYKLSVPNLYTSPLQVFIYFIQDQIFKAYYHIIYTNK